MERGVSNFAEREFTFFFLFLFFLQSGWKRRVPKYCKVLFNNVVSCEVVSFFLFFSTVTYYRRFGLLYLLFAFTLRNIDALQRNKILKFCSGQVTFNKRDVQRRILSSSSTCINTIDISMLGKKKKEKNIHELQNYKTSIHPSSTKAPRTKLLHSSRKTSTFWNHPRNFSSSTPISLSNNPLPLTNDPPSGIQKKKKKTKSNLGPFSATQGNNVCQGSNN